MLVRSRGSKVVRAGTKLNQLTISPDGQTIYLTAYDPAATNQLLYSWDRKGPLKRIGGAKGYHADPVLSPDGKYLYFAHHPEGGGPPGTHDARANAQIYRVPVEGGVPEALTAALGCHYAPSFAANPLKLFIVHTNCSMSTVIEQLDVATKTSNRIVTDFLTIDELTVSDDGSRVLFVAPNMTTVAVYEAAVAATRETPRKLLEVPNEELRLRPQYGANLGEVYFQSRSSVWRWTANEMKEVLKLRGGVR
jgi:Tol biopolymer transport system component